MNITNKEKVFMINILSDFFPNDLYYIILEYVLPIKHEFHLIKKVKCRRMRYDPIDCVSNNKLYTYYNNVLKSKLMKQMHYPEQSNKICEYNNNIYVLTDHSIFVFNKKCERMPIYTTINMYNYTSIHIIKNKIFIGKRGLSYIIVLNLHCELIKYIRLLHNFYSMTRDFINIYVLAVNEHIYK